MKQIKCDNERIVLSKANYHNPNTYNALDSAIAVLIFALISIGLQYALEPLIKQLYTLTNDYMLCNCVALIITQGLLALIVLLFSLIRRVGYCQGGGLVCKFNITEALFGGVLCLGLMFVLAHTHGAFADNITYLFYGMNYEDYTQSTGIMVEGINPFLTMIFTFVLTPLLPAVCEEVFFRGLVMRGLRQFGDFTAVILSSAIFALMHGRFEQIFLQFVIGVAIGSAVIITDNIFVGMAMHFLYNLLAVIYSVFYSLLHVSPKGYYYLYESSTIIIGVILAIIGLVYFGRMFLNKYKKETLYEPRTAHYKSFYVIEEECNKQGKFNALYYCSVTPEYYTKDYDFKFYHKKGFVKFNKISPSLPPKIILGAGICLAVIKLFLSL